jgi:hypothetical protein
MAAGGAGDGPGGVRLAMTQDEAKAEILRAWRALPADERRTDHQAAAFAMKLAGEYRFRCSGDRYQVIKGWLLNALAP